MPGRPLLALATAAALAVAACADGDGASGDAVAVDVPDGFSVEVVADGLDGPTQIALHPDGGLLVAELGGGEGDGVGRLLHVDGDRREALAIDLLAPTGVAVFDGDLWIMERSTLTRRPLAGGEPTVVADDLPNNGRSEGTLTVLDPEGPAALLLYDTSGRQRGADVTPRSGTLFALEPDGTTAEVAKGLKHGYAQVAAGARTLFVTEIGDGRYDGEVPPDELVLVDLDEDPPPDFGWPRCIGDRVPVVEFGGTADECDRTGRPHALFAPRATPTSVAVAPWDPETLLVALWNEGVVVEVPVEPAATPHAGVPFLTGIANPQHLLADGDRLLVVDHAGGRILAVTRT